MASLLEMTEIYSLESPKARRLFENNKAEGNSSVLIVKRRYGKYGDLAKVSEKALIHLSDREPPLQFLIIIIISIRLK